MHIALRHCITTGLAIVGVGTLVAAPVALPADAVLPQANPVGEPPVADPAFAPTFRLLSAAQDLLDELYPRVLPAEFVEWAHDRTDRLQNRLNAAGTQAAAALPEPVRGPLDVVAGDLNDIVDILQNSPDSTFRPGATIDIYVTRNDPNDGPNYTVTDEPPAKANGATDMTDGNMATPFGGDGPVSCAGQGVRDVVTGLGGGVGGVVGGVGGGARDVVGGIGGGVGGVVGGLGGVVGGLTGLG